MIVSAKNLPVQRHLEFGDAALSDILSPHSASLIDINIFAARDAQLAYRDLLLALMTSQLGARIGALWGIPMPKITLAGPPKNGSELYQILGYSDSNQVVHTSVSQKVRPFSARIVVDGVSCFDDGQGNFPATTTLVSGSITYLTGDIRLVTRKTAVECLISCIMEPDLAANLTDVVGSGDTPAAVTLVSDASVARDALITDQQLYTRDLTLQTAIARASQQLQKIPQYQPLAAVLSDPLFVERLSSAVIDDDWASQVGAEAPASILQARKLTPDSFAKPDRALLARDNVIAAVVADLAAVFQPGEYLQRAQRVIVRATAPSSDVLATDSLNSIITDSGAELALRAARRVDLPEVNWGWTDETGSPVLTELGEPIELLVPGAYAIRQKTDIEPESMTLVSEVGSIRVYQSAPHLPYDQGVLIYNRAERVVEFRDESETGALLNVPVAESFQNHGQLVELLSSVPQAQDCQYFRQKAGRLLVNLYEEISGSINQFGPTTNPGARGSLREFGENKVYSGYPYLVAANSPLSFANVLSLYKASVPFGAMQVRASILFRPVDRLAIRASEYVVASSSGTFPIVETSAVQLPVASSSNVGVQITNVPNIAWFLKLPPGGYKLRFRWRSTISAVGYNVSARYDGAIIWTSQMSAETSWAWSPAISLSIVDSIQGVFTLTLNSQSGPGFLQVLDLEIQKTDSTTEQDVALRLDLSNRTSNSGDLWEREENSDLIATENGDNIMLDRPVAYETMTAGRINNQITIYQNRADTVTTGWIDASDLAGKTEIALVLSSASELLMPLQILQVDAHIRVRTKPIEAAQAREALLHRTKQRLCDAYQRSLSNVPPESSTEFRITSGSSLLWTNEASQAWYQFLALSEPRLWQAFRPAGPTDIGKPALVPEGLELQPDGSVLAQYEAKLSYPNIAVFQPWMATIGILVAQEELWTTH